MQIWLHKHVCSPYMHSLIPVLNIFCNGLIEQIGIYQVYSQTIGKDDIYINNIILFILYNSI